MPIVTGVTPKAYAAHAQMWKHIGKQSAYVTSELIVGPRRSIRDIRNEACRTAIETEASHLFFLDDDIMPPPDIIDRLLAVRQRVIRFVQYVVAGLVLNHEGRPIVFSGNLLAGEEHWDDCPRSGVFECFAVGSGAMLIPTEILKALDQPWFWFDKSKRTMDVNFCREVQFLTSHCILCEADATCKQIVHEERAI